MKKRKAWDGRWFNTRKGRLELLVQCSNLRREVGELLERVNFLQALTQKAVVELAKKQK